MFLFAVLTPERNDESAVKYEPEKAEETLGKSKDGMVMTPQFQNEFKLNGRDH
jgi:hypothetical protein